MNKEKPKLIPVIVPWMISASVPFLRLHEDKNGIPHSATFIAFFQCDNVLLSPPTNNLPQKIVEPKDFISSKQDEKAPFHFIRVIFINPIAGRVCRSFSDLQIIPEDEYNWSAVLSELKPGETIEMNINRRRIEWLKTGVCLDPRMYEVFNSAWLHEIGQSEKGMHHYLLLGHDEYVEVIAGDWIWEKGQLS